MLNRNFVIDSMATQLFVDNMAEQNDVGGDGGCGNGCLWKDRKHNIALITGITGQVTVPIGFGCRSRCCPVCVFRSTAVHLQAMRAVYR